MAHIKVSYQDLVGRYPDALKEIEGKIRRGVSKHKDDALESFTWAFDWGVEIKGLSFEDLVSGKASKGSSSSIPNKKDISATLVAKKGTGKWYSSLLKGVPKEIMDFYKAEKKKEDLERKRYSSLSQAEKDKELKETLRKLSSFGGAFVSVVLDKKQKK